MSYIWSSFLKYSMSLRSRLIFFLTYGNLINWHNIIYPKVYPVLLHFSGWHLCYKLGNHTYGDLDNLFLGFLFCSICLLLCDLNSCLFIINIDIGNESFQIFFFLKVVLVIFDLLHFYNHFRISLSIYTNNIFRVFIGISLNL